MAERAAFKRFMVVFTLLQFAFAFSVWAFYSNLFALFAGAPLSQPCMSSSSAHLFSLHVVAVQHGGALTYASCHRVQETLLPATLIIWLSKLLWCVVLQAPFMGCKTRATTGRRSLGLLRAPSLEASCTASA